MKLKVIKFLALVLSIKANGETEELFRGKRNENVDDLKDLLMASMQNTIALTEVVTQQTQKISDVMLSLSAARIDVQELKLKIGKMELDEVATTATISELKEDLHSLKDDVKTLSD